MKASRLTKSLKLNTKTSILVMLQYVPMADGGGDDVDAPDSLSGASSPRS